MFRSRPSHKKFDRVEVTLKLPEKAWFCAIVSKKIFFSRQNSCKNTYTYCQIRSVSKLLVCNVVANAWFHITRRYSIKSYTKAIIIFQTSFLNCISLLRGVAAYLRARVCQPTAGRVSTCQKTETNDQHVISKTIQVVLRFLDQNYRYESVIKQIFHNTKRWLLPYFSRNFYLPPNI